MLLIRAYTFLLLLLLAACIPGISAAGDTRSHGEVTGRIVGSDGPMGAGAMAFFVVGQGSDPADRSIPRIPDRIARVDDQGRFHVALGFGRYLLGYLPGNEKEEPGLPGKEATYFLARTGGGEPFVLEVSSPRLESGDVTFSPLVPQPSGPFFSVEGTVRNEKGRAIPGITVVAKTRLDHFRPKYVSRKTDRSGHYSLSLPPGRYYLVARHRLRRFGRPAKGEYFGIWGVEGPAGEFGWFPLDKEPGGGMIQGSDGQVISGADITVFRIPDPVTQEEVLRAKGKK